MLCCYFRKEAIKDAPALRDPCAATTEAELELREAARAANESAQSLYGGQNTIATLRFGYRAGVAATLAVWVMWDCVEVVNSVHKKVSHDSVAAKAAWPLVRACGVVLAWHWLWGLCLWVWNRFRVNAPFCSTWSTPEWKSTSA